MQTKGTERGNGPAVDDLPPEVLQAIEQGKKLEAIKLLRESSGLGLANAKMLVDRAARKHSRETDVPRIVVEQADFGPLLKALFVVLLAYGLWHYLTTAGG